MYERWSEYLTTGMVGTNQQTLALNSQHSCPGATEPGVRADEVGGKA